jgi:hypothetical protein
MMDETFDGRNSKNHGVPWEISRIYFKKGYMGSNPGGLPVTASADWDLVHNNLVCGGSGTIVSRTDVVRPGRLYTIPWVDTGSTVQ